MRYTLIITFFCFGLAVQLQAQCTTGGATWLNGQNDGIFRDTGLLGGYVTVEARTVGTMTLGRPLYRIASSTWKGLTYDALQVWRAYSSIATNYTSFKLDKPLDSTYFHVRVDNIRGDFFNWESQNVRGYLNGVEVPADFKDPVNGATVSNNTISGPATTTSAIQAAMRVFFQGPVDSIVVRQTSVSDWIIAELMIQCNVMLPLHLEKWNAARSGSDVLINWKMGSEEDIKKYILEKSTDGMHFSAISEIFPGTYPYQYVDKNAGAGKLYYRLKTQSKNGEIVYSTTLLIKALTVLQGAIQIFPNPAREGFTVSLPHQWVNGIIYNAEGSPVFTFKGKDAIRINTYQWPRGQYFIRLQYHDEVRTERIMVL